VSAEKQLSENFVCTKCKCRKAVTKSVSLGGALPNLLSLSGERYVLISCSACGYTEIYNTAAYALEPEAAPVKAPEAAAP